MSLNFLIYKMEILIFTLPGDLVGFLQVIVEKEKKREKYNMKTSGDQKCIKCM